MYSALFASTLHMLKTPNWLTIRLYDRLMLDPLPIICGFVHIRYQFT